MKKKAQSSEAATKQEKKRRFRVIAIRIYNDDIEKAAWLAENASLTHAAVIGIRASYDKLKPVVEDIGSYARKRLDADPGEIKYKNP
jgi:hypothetical protein